MNSIDLAVLPLSLEGVEDGEYAALLHCSTDAARVSNKFAKGVHGFLHHGFSLCRDLLSGGSSAAVTRSAVLASGRWCFFCAPVEEKFLVALEVPRFAALHGDLLLRGLAHWLRAAEVTAVEAFDEPQPKALDVNSSGGTSGGWTSILAPSLEQRLGGEGGETLPELQRRVTTALRAAALVASPVTNPAIDFSALFERPIAPTPPHVVETMMRIVAQAYSFATIASAPVASPVSCAGGRKQRRFVEIGSLAWVDGRRYWGNMHTQLDEQVTAIIALHIARDIVLDSGSKGAHSSASSSSGIAAASRAVAYLLPPVDLTSRNFGHTTPLGGGLVKVQPASRPADAEGRVLLVVFRGRFIVATVATPANDAAFIGAPFQSIRHTLLANVEALERVAPAGLRAVVPRPKLSELRTNGFSAVQAFAVIGEGGAIHTFERCFDFCVSTRLCFLGAVRRLRRASTMCFGSRSSFTVVDFRTGTSISKQQQPATLTLAVEQRRATRVTGGRGTITVAVLVAARLGKGVPPEGAIARQFLRQLPSVVLAKAW